MATRTTNIIEEITRPGCSGLGILQALRDSSMTIEDAETDLFNLDTYKTARRRRFDPRLIEFLEWGMELDDVATLVPDGLDESYTNMERLLLGVISQSLAKRRGTR